RSSSELGLWVEPRERERLVEQVRATGSVKGFEAKIRRRDGETIDTVAAIETIELNGERYLLALTNDVTDIKRSELALKQSEERFSKAFRASPVGIVISSLPEGRVIDANDAYLAMFGYRRDELIGRTAAELDLWADPAERAALYRQLEEHGRIRDFEARFRKKSGETGFSLASAERIELNGAPCLLSLMNDITERKRAEEALRAKDEEMRAMTQQMWQAAKLATMGELAASVAHELNNPLGTVSLRVESLLTKAGADESARKPLEVIQHEVERMGALVANLLQFSRRAAHQISTLDLREEIARTLDLMHFHLRKCNVRLVQEIAPDLPMIQADRQLLRQVFLNLFTNACDAMPKGGTLTIRAAPANADVLIEVTDTGVGIPPEDLPKVTEPFYTTKPEGRGTGLGLAICRRVVQEHHGTLEVLSEGVPGKGTTVRIRLPRRNGTNGKAVRGDA
ncbi:MAG: ATP-binding protein, partial [Chloroflexota bacterium]